MNDDPLDVRQAIADVALLRRVLHQIEQRRTSQESAGLFGTTLNANMLLQGGALCTALVLVIVEIFSDNAISRALMLGNESLDLRLAGILKQNHVFNGFLTDLSSFWAPFRPPKTI